MHVFVDESERRSYLLCAAVVVADVDRARTSVRALRKPGQRRVHFAKEGDTRRREILSALVELGLHARVYVSPAAGTPGRQACLEALVGDLVAAGAERLTLESRRSMDHLDEVVIRATLRRTGPGRLTYGHKVGFEEPLLWVPDAIAWAYGRGGDWRRRVDPLLDKVVHLGP